MRNLFTYYLVRIVQGKGLAVCKIYKLKSSVVRGSRVEVVIIGGVDLKNEWRRLLQVWKTWPLGKRLPKRWTRW
nr:Biomphalaria glabrata zinc finger protein GIS2-like [Biomphalaria glabrata]